MRPHATGIVGAADRRNPQVRAVAAYNVHILIGRAGLEGEGNSPGIREEGREVIPFDGQHRDLASLQTQKALCSGKGLCTGC